MNEQKLIAQILSGHTASFKVLVDEYYAYVYRIVYGILKNHYDTEDVLQEVFVQVYKSLHLYRFEGFKSWIKRIAINKAIDYKRRRTRNPDYSQLDDLQEGIAFQESELVEATIIRKERIQRIKEELNAVPESYQNIIQAFYMDHKSYDEISSELGVEKKTVESKLYRARRWLKQHWAREDF